MINQELLNIINNNNIIKFWLMIDKKGEDDCWNWIRGRFSSGYGQFSANTYEGRKVMRSHRFVYEITYGKILGGMQINHKCDNKLCCNPKHLYIGTQQDNVDDREYRGRSGKSKLTTNDVLKIRQLHKSGKFNQRMIADMFKVHPSQISLIISHKNWSWVV